MTIASLWSWVANNWLITTIPIFLLGVVGILKFRTASKITSALHPREEMRHGATYEIKSERHCAHTVEQEKPSAKRIDRQIQESLGALLKVEPSHEAEHERAIERIKALQQRIERQEQLQKEADSATPQAKKRDKQGAPRSLIGSSDEVEEHAGALPREERQAPIMARFADPSPLAIEAGRLAYQIPTPMWVGLVEPVEVRLGRDQAVGLKIGFVGRGDVRDADTPIVERMSVMLTCKPDAFSIHSASPAEQLVMRDAVRGTPFEGADYAKWQWLVTPLKKGNHQLTVKVSGAVRDSQGQPVSSSLPDKEFPVRVKVRLLRSIVGRLGGGVRALIWTAITALVGAATKDIWWPLLREWLRVHGYL